MIEVKQVSHRFGDGSTGLDGISLRIAAGEFVVIAGANGSGKTSLLRHLNGLLKPDRGSVWVDGLDVTRNLCTARQRVGMVFQDADSQIVGETVADDVAFGPQNLGLPPAEIERRVAHALAVVGLAGASQKRPHLLSGGEKRRLAIAGILAMQPKVIAFDEPFSNLDYGGVRQVLAEIVRLHTKGHTILVATHELEKVIAHAGRLIILQNGRLVHDGRPQELLPIVERYGIRQPWTVRMGKKVDSWLN